MKFYQRHKRFSMMLTFALFVLAGACGFPIYNLTREWSTTLTLSIVFVGVSLSFTLGASEAAMLPNPVYYNKVMRYVQLKYQSGTCWQWPSAMEFL